MPGRVIANEPITKETLQSLVTDAIAEGQTLEYKRAINLATREAKLEFCSDIAAFANASGGDIVFGIEQDGDGKAKGLVELSGFSKDATERQLRQVLNAHVDPPLTGLIFEEVGLSERASVLVIRISRSWNRPHSVQADYPIFPIRDGNQKRSLKVRELREAFGLSRSIADHMKRFRAERIAALVAGDTPVSLLARPLIGLHIMPIRAFDEPLLLDIKAGMKKEGLLWPIDTTGLTTKINFDGLLTYSPSFGPAEAYVQLFRNSCIEAVDTGMLARGANKKTLYSGYEARIEIALRRYLSFLQSEGVEPPVFLALTLVNVNGYKVSMPAAEVFDLAIPSIDRDILVVPETRVESYAESYHDVLREPFDRVWQASGRVGSPNYKDGVWIRREGV